MTAYVFPGQGSQFEGMGKDLYETSPIAKELLDQANDILGYDITSVMFNGTAEELKETKITQPAVFLHSIVKAKMAGDSFQPDMVAGHSLGEFSALVAAGAMNFADGLTLVKQRALAMQKACEMTPSTMAAVLGLDDDVVEDICNSIDDVVVPANYNCPGQLVISGSIAGIDKAVEKCTEAGARRAIVLQVGGAFHSPLMQPAKEELKAALEATSFSKPMCPIYQNVNARPETDPEVIRKNLIDQLTAPVRWTQTMQNMIADGADMFIEVGGTGKVLRGFVSRVDRKMSSETL
ncbi:MAG: ACP S-malonyltransferase [Saprospiraceae bacterium]|nr:ACP S-malonyltransferase [Saprospiraceae bacterium]